VIPQANVTAWGNIVRWPTDDQVEQDLVLARLIVEIANDAYLGSELVFRGGTCLHKLHLAPAPRYSDDLDYVRVTPGGIKAITQALGAIGDRLGMQVRTQVSAFPKIMLRAPFESGAGTMRVKIEVSTHERSPARDLIRTPFAVDSPWFAGQADVLTFCLPELVATKLRALYQRSKGRDLFDLWLAVTRLEVAPADIVECFAPYRPARYTRRLAVQNLEAKVADAAFRSDLERLIAVWPPGYDIDEAAGLVIDRVFALL
jgi:predicted nucleotidyltransferase component of viral defense system